MHLFYADSIAQGSLVLSEEESFHAIKVMRLGVGSEMRITDGLGNIYQAKITEAHHKKCAFEVISRETGAGKAPGYIHIAVAPTKNMDRNEWLTEKCVEIGIHELSFVHCRHSERKEIKTDRIIKTAIAAIKQSLKAWMPKVNEMEKFEAFINKPFKGDKYIAYVSEGNEPLLNTVATPGDKALVLVGPEGDFSPEEIAAALKKGFKPVSLGPSRLRTETAAVVVSAMLSLG